MAKHIGIVACSAEGAALCYRTICAEGARVMGEHNHPEITMHTHPLAEYMAHIRAGQWRAVANLMLSSARILAQAGADFIICPDNTIHQAFDLVRQSSTIPWLHIAQAVAAEARKKGYASVAVLGTKYLMEGPVYSQSLEEHGIKRIIPNEGDREKVNAIIFKELVYGVFTEESRAYFNRLIGQMKNDGAKAVVLGCTEIPLLVHPEELVLPTLDSTRLLAHAALRQAVR